MHHRRGRTRGKRRLADMTIRPDDNRAFKPKGATEPLPAIPEPELDEAAAERLFDRTVDRKYRGMLSADIEEE